jgi:hypothetical protein
MIRIRPYCQLDELLLTRCINHHDEPEGIMEIDKPAPLKVDADDLNEYLVFEKLYSPLGLDVWAELRDAFLLQFCLANPACFPEDAREVMSYLALAKRREALFFDGVQRMDYFFYALECYAEHGIMSILIDVARGQIVKLDKIAEELPGFRETIWTPAVEIYFRNFAEQLYFDELDPV